MAEKTPKVGDRVIHHGRHHEITELPKRARMGPDGPEAVELVVFENDGYRVLGNVSELRYSKEDGAWYLPGRVLSRNERAVLQAMSGTWPPADAHLSMRALLDRAVDNGELEGISRTRLRQVLIQRKADVTEDNVDDYIPAAIAQVSELREIRRNGEEG